MEKQISFSELIESFDSFVSENRSSFSLEECRILDNVRLKLLELNAHNSHVDKSLRRTIIQSIISELMKILIDSKTWNDIKNLF